MSKIYWHGSCRELQENDVLISPFLGMRVYASSGPHLSGDEVTEGILERNKPPEFVSRSCAVFMTGHPDDIDAAGGYTDYICAVKPTAPVSAHDAAWISSVQCALSDGNRPLAHEHARNYWAGVPYSDQSASLTEYVAASAEVIRVWAGDDEPDAYFTMPVKP